MPPDIERLVGGARLRIDLDGRVMTVVLGGRLRPGGVGWVERAVARQLSAHGPYVLRCDVGRLPVDLGTVAALARLGLLARRAGCTIEVVDGSASLQALLRVTGLDTVLPVDPPPSSGGGPLGVRARRPSRSLRRGPGG